MTITPIKLVLVFMFLTSFAQAKDMCSCLPLPSTKTYPGNPRKKHILGYSVAWSCTYKCSKVTIENGIKNEALVQGSYLEHYFFEENGLEGVCEGMIYEPVFNVNLNRYIYTYNGKNTDFNPLKSNSRELVQWAKFNSCQ